MVLVVVTEVPPQIFRLEGGQGQDGSVTDGDGAGHVAWGQRRPWSQKTRRRPAPHSPITSTSATAPKARAFLVGLAEEARGPGAGRPPRRCWWRESWGEAPKACVSSERPASRSAWGGGGCVQRREDVR